MDVRPRERQGTTVRVEIAYARPERQQIVTLDLPLGTTAREAVKYARLDKLFSDVTSESLESGELGVFGQRLPEPERYILADGDRIELYRELVLDPKQARLARAKRKR